MLLFLTAFIYFCVFAIVGISVGGAMCFIYRFKRGESWFKGRSYCEGCHRQLAYWEIFPVIGAVIRKGKCPKCGHVFGYKYAMTEGLIATLAVVCFHYMVNPLFG